MRNPPISLLCFIAAFASFPAIGQTVTPDISIVNTITAAIIGSADKLMPQAVMWLGSFMAIQFIVTNLALLKSGGDIEAVFGKLIGSLTWFGFCIYLLNNGPDFIQSVGNGILNKFASNVPTPSSIILSTLGLAALLLAGITAIGTSIVGIGNSSLAMVLVYMFFVVLAIGLYMTVKIVMLYLELGLIVALAPLSFSLLGLNALRDQGIAPFKSLIALVYRIILLGIICTAFTNIAHVTYDTINNLHWVPGSFGKGLEAVMASLCAYPILAFLVYKSDSIAANLAGGGSSLGASDVASAAAAGAAAGSALGSASGGTVGLVGKIPQSMSSVLGHMMGTQGGAISNASSSGAGSTSASKPPGATASLGGQTGKPSAPSFPTNKAGAPQAPEFHFNKSHPAAQAAADARDAKSFEEDAGSNPNAGIGGGSDKQPAAIPGRRGQGTSFGQNVVNLGHHLSQERATTNVSISPHHE